MLHFSNSSYCNWCFWNLCSLTKKLACYIWIWIWTFAKYKLRHLKLFSNLGLVGRLGIKKIDDWKSWMGCAVTEWVKTEIGIEWIQVCWRLCSSINFKASYDKNQDRTESIYVEKSYRGLTSLFDNTWITSIRLCSPKMTIVLKHNAAEKHLGC